MEPLAILHADPLDLLFENRNKSYGAYPLRKYYPQRLMISFGITMFLVMLILSFILYPASSTSVMQKFTMDPVIILQDVDVTAYKKPEIQSVRPFVPKPPVASANFKPFIVPDPLVTEPLPTVDRIESVAIGLKATEGSSGNEQPPIYGHIAGAGIAQSAEGDENKNKVLDIAEIMPEFPGGIEALQRFLIRNLRMPENNLEEGTQVKVIARFVVGVDGRVRDIEIVLPADAEFNAEVKRVIGKMPDWKPGSQNHRNVAVYFNLPVNFVRTQ